MTIIDPNQPLAAAMQSQLAALRERARARGATSTAQTRAPGSVARGAESSMAQRIQAIAANDPDRRQKAVRVFLESELAREFGDKLLNDPAFPRMLDDVQQQMQQDPQTAAAVQALGDVLLSAPQR